MLEILLMIILIIFIIILFSRIKISLTFTKNDKTFKGQIKIIIIEKIKIYTYNFTSQHINDDKTSANIPDIRKIYNALKSCKEDLINYLKVIIKKMKITKAKNHIIFGLDNYAETGTYIGIIWGILAIVNQFDENLKISAEPSFNGSRLNICGENNIEINLYKVIIPTIQLISKKNIRELIKGLIHG